MADHTEFPLHRSEDRPVSLPVDLIHAAEPQKPKLLLPALLLVLTILSTLVAGFIFHVQFSSETEVEAYHRISEALAHPVQVLEGLDFAAAILLILLAHELGHFLACRFYRLNASLPHLIPAPPVLYIPFIGWFSGFLFGTFGAVIRIRSQFRNVKQLFDVGVAGPIAGFLLIVPVLILGMVYSTEFHEFEQLEGMFMFGEPLLFKWAASLFYRGDPYLLNLHPIGWAAWFGMIATSLNLLPVGQLDGGHIVYALFGEKVHRIVSYATFGGLILLGIFAFYGYLFFAVLLVILRFRHPRPYIGWQPLGKARMWTAIVALVIFILTFMPVPVTVVENSGTL